MAKITMLKDAHGSPDHISTKLYKADQTYDVPDVLAKAFIEDLKVAEPAGRRAAAQAAEEKKMEAGAPENKSAAPAEETAAGGEIAQAAAKKAGAARRP